MILDLTDQEAGFIFNVLKNINVPAIQPDSFIACQVAQSIAAKLTAKQEETSREKA